jgi:hypothetical protein
MPTTANALSEQAMLLPPEERLALVDRLLDTRDEPDPALDALWATEAQSRLEAYRRREVEAMALSDVIAKYLPAAKK